MQLFHTVMGTLFQRTVLFEFLGDCRWILFKIEEESLKEQWSVKDRSINILSDRVICFLICISLDINSSFITDILYCLLYRSQ